MRLSVPRPPVTGHFTDLVRQVEALRNEAARAAECADVRLREVAAGRRRSLENLHAYLALRAHDLRPLQQDLDRLGVASLDHAELHVLPTLGALLTNLYLLDGQKVDPAILPDPYADFDAGPRLLKRNTARLLGPAAGRRRGLSERL